MNTDNNSTSTFNKVFNSSKKYQAAIDIGSNSVNLIINEIVEGAVISPKTIMYTDSQVTGLGKGVAKNGVLSNDSIDKTLYVLEVYSKKIKEFSIDPSLVRVVATAAARQASNTQKFINEVREKLNFYIEVISGEEEARLSAIGASIDLKHRSLPYLIMDIGGASTEFILFDKNQNRILNSVSLPMGVVKLSDMQDDYLSSNPYIELLQSYSNHEIICVAGTMTSLGNMLLGNSTFQENDLHMTEFDLSDLTKILYHIRSKSSAELLSQYPFLKERSLTIHSASSWVEYIFKNLGVKKFTVSCYGLRVGLLIDRP